MDTPLREGPQILLDSRLLTEILQRSTLIQPDSVDVFEGHLETSEYKGRAHYMFVWVPHNLFEYIA